MAVSMAVFCPQSRAPEQAYLDSIQSFITNHHVLQHIVQNITTLLDVWPILAQENPEISQLSQGPRYAKLLIEWLVDGISDGVISTSSGIVALPRLVIIQITQYFQFLESRDMTHADFTAQVRDSGGVQGYCGGLPAAVALACAKNEPELIQLICTAIRLAYAIGVYAELGDDSGIPGTTTIVVRLKREGQAEELTYISAITDPKSVSIVGPVKQLADLQAFANQQGLLVQSMDIRGKVHNPENADLATELVAICRETALLDLPRAESLQVPVRSNRTGDCITAGSLTEEIVKTVLASRCEWFKLLSNVAADLNRTGIDTHNLVSFGIGDCVPLMPFNMFGVRMAKTNWSGRKGSQPPRRARSEILGGYSYPEDAIAIVGASCRLPGARNMDELWDLISKGVDKHQELKHDRFDLYGSFRASQTGNFTKNRKFYGNFIEGAERFDNSFFGINPREMVNMDPQQRILLELSYEAMESSGYTRSHLRENGDAVGCFIGASFIEYLDNTNAHPPTAYTSTGTIRAFLCGRLSYYFGWTGPAEVIDTACSSSLVAINRACKAIQGGECSMALTGGINIMTGANNFLDLARAGFLSPTGQCKPFDQNADGYCRAEGAGLVVLKSLKRAQSDGDYIMAVIPSAATNQGGLSSSLTIPDSAAQAKMYKQVLQKAVLSPDQVTYVEAHGTGTQAGDPLEVASVRSVFGSSTRNDELHIGSIKGNIGHCETAAGVAGLLKVISMLDHQAIPPQASHITWNSKIPALAPDRMAIAKELRVWDAPIRAAMINSYGAAGSNAAVLCCEGPNPPQGDTVSIPGLKHPIIISAASLSSLKAYKKSLASYLAKATPQPNIAEIAYTLSEKRQRHKCHYAAFEACDTTELIRTLLSDQESTIKRPTSNTVVLMFGGQSKQTIGLSKELYEHFITFRTYMNLCDNILQELGHPPILPAVFDTGNVSDIVVLQSGFVAIQYASALTWIDAGLKVKTIVGHSLGELTALAVSGMLSIRDCLKLVAARADLMKRKWGQDKGSMLAIFASRPDVQQLIASTNLSSTNSKLEVACYNSETSQVVSGDHSAIADLENHLLLRSPSIKYLHIDTSHGFHSRLVEPILEDLNQVSYSLDWNEPTIPIEICAQDSSPSDIMYMPSDHARNPVYFSDTVKRIEHKHGQCIWLEAGMNTPIISMTRRATSQSNGHLFYAMSTKDEGIATNLISRIICGLWQSSLHVTHWSFLQTECVPKQVWLPPYQFDPTAAWLDNIDRVAELQRQLKERPEMATREESPLNRPYMVTLLPNTTNSGQKKHFKISVGGERFRSIVSGHAVRHRPLCPASVYLECAAMALDIVEGGLQKSNLDFEGLDIQAPLGIGAEHVEVTLQEQSAGKWWEFTIISRDNANHEKTTLHAKGLLMKSSDSKLDTMARLLGKRMEALAGNEDAERMLSKRAYDLFSRVVTYDKFLKGITSILMNDTEAVAKITIPADQPGLDESTVAGVCDAVSLDNFIQVVGLLMNTSDMVDDREVMVCTGIENSMICKGCDMVGCRSWTVHASFTPTSASQAIGDVFAFSEDGTIAAAFTGCRFAKLDVTRLERLLDPVNRNTSGKQAQRLDHGVLSSSTSHNIERLPGLTSDTSTALSSDDEIETPPSIRENTLREMLETYTGAAASSILGEAMIADLGLDSLAASEMAGELQFSYEVILDSQDLLSMTVKELENRLYGTSLRKSLKEKIQAIQGGVNDSVGPSPETIDPTQRGSILLANKLTDLLIETTGVSAPSIKAQTTLEELGVDSLALTEILSGLMDESTAALNTDDISLQSRVEEVLAALGVSGDARETNNSRDVVAHSESKHGTSDGIPQSSSSKSNSSIESKKLYIKMDPQAGLHYSNAQFENAARNRGFQNYWNDVAIKQDKLVLAYVLEAFTTLGVDFSSLEKGNRVPNITHLPKHSKIVQRLWDILEKHGIINRENATICRGAKSALSPSASELHQEFINQHATYSIEAQLMAITGSNLAECLKGDADPIRLLFGTAGSGKILEEYYGHSPMLSTLTDQLVTFIMGSLGNSNGPQPAPLRVLEVGAGTGGTTARLVDRLAASGIIVEYTFTDVSSTMVSKAKKKFVQYSWVSFEKFDLEQSVPPHMKGKFDIIIGTNCVHATSDKAATTSRIRDMLNNDGFMVLSEVTRIIDWYDIVFGMLEGWWLADCGLSYPLQPAETWMTAFRKAGFSSGLFSQGTTEDSNTQQLLIGCNRLITDPSGESFMLPKATNLHEKQTVVYKEVGTLQIKADIFVPTLAKTAPMPIALMLHGGGHMTLSRTAIRPAQTAYLLLNGILPISLDYRLCPEINLVDGAMTDVRDAFSWARSILPSILRHRGIALDTERIAVIGWSTGGHLAMSSAWTVGAAGETPPKAILSFYAPTDFLSKDAFTNRGASIIPHSMTREQILKANISEPISNYSINGGDSPELNWAKSGDLRSELLLSLFREPREYGLSLMLNGQPGAEGNIEKLLWEPPSLQRQAAICPTARLQAGQYNVPTYIIHGDQDNIASFEAASKFHKEMSQRGIKSGLLVVKNGHHIHDLHLKPGNGKWDEQVAPGYRFLFDALNV
ncbi:Uncharacterized protein BP5553_00026 [Venustampulla echinocandica]|uniref:Polyketide synthase n=1 Tax=Venustampulla echinocandica TaxID=2656787 RepID=A0A370TWZ9_9HELO|nr:Uncharacterized protein BP5553_00026 [Venustampulla echinocandica]RDL40047.1 Uncharacterized protein BP5553_00026 [Venustampulla echinocandica]